MTLLQELSKSMRLSAADINELIATAPKRYKVYQIAKRSGGLRTIAHPARELKALQRHLIELAPAQLRVHNVATAYESGSSILKNAEIHANNCWIGRLDFANFFNSITPQNWEEFLLSNSVNEDFRIISSKVFFWQPRKANSLCLSVGAPSSPFVSNRIMHEFDERVCSLCEPLDLLYTRYADDLTISSSEKFDIDAIANKIASIIPDYLELGFNLAKSRLSGPGSRKVVTGLIVTDNGHVTIGKKRRKLIEAYVEHYLKGTSTVTEQELKGHLAFLRHIEPDVFVRLSKKYSDRLPSLFD